MKTVWYEALKAYVNKLLPVVIILALVGNGALLVQSLSGKYPGSFIYKNKQMYNRVLDEYKDMPVERAYWELKAKNDELQALAWIQSLAENTFGEPQEMIDDQLRQVEEENPGITKKYHSGDYTLYSGDIHTDSSLVNSLYEKISYIHGYPEYVATMTDRMNEMLSVSIFYKEGTFAYRNIVRTPQDFAALQDAKLALGLDEGIVGATSFAATDVFIIFIAFLMCVYLISLEKDRKLLQLVKSTRGGRGATIAAKLGVLALSVGVLSLLFYGSNLLIGAQTLGLGDLLRPVQSISDFRGCSGVMSVGQYIGLFLLSKAAVAVLISALLFSVILLASNSSMAYAVIAAALALEWVAWKYIGVTSYINHLKFINIFGFLDAFGLYANYQNLNLFGYPVNVRLLFAVITPTGIAALASLSVIAFIRLRQGEKVSLILRAVDAVRKLLGRLPGAVSLFWHESYKLLISQKALLILAALLVLQVYSVSQFFVVKYTDRVIYGHYLAEVRGGLNEDTRDYIAREQANFDNASSVVAQAAEDYKQNKITETQYNGVVNRNAVMQERATAFAWITAQYEYLDGLGRERGIGAWFVDPAGYAQLLSLNGYSDDLANQLLLTAVIIACLAAAFAQENAIRAKKIIITCREGRGSAVISKMLACFIVAVIAAALVYGAQLYNLIKWHGLSDWDAPVQSVMAFDNAGPHAVPWLNDFPLNLSIGQYLFILYGIRLCGVAVLVSVVLLASALSSNLFVSIFAATAALELPALLYLLGLDISRYFSLTAILSGNMLMAGENQALAIILIPMLGAGVSVALLLASRRIFCKLHFS